MSTQSRRGRRAQSKKNTASSLRTFYWIIGAVVIIGAAVLITIVARGGIAGEPVEPVNIPAPNAPVGTTDQGFYFKGNPEAPVTVIEFSDYQCPACANFAETLGPVITRDYVETGQVQFVFHEFPLSQHVNGPVAAAAARCAGEQDHFWQMHDLIFLRQREWATLSSPASRLVTYAQQLGLDRGEFQECLNSGRYDQAIAAAGQSAVQAGIPATPTFLVNGQQVRTLELQQAIEAALAENQ